MDIGASQDPVAVLWFLNTLRYNIFVPAKWWNPEQWGGLREEAKEEKYPAQMAPGRPQYPISGGPQKGIYIIYYTKK